MRWRVISHTGKLAVLEGDGLQIRMDKQTGALLCRIFLGLRAGTILGEGVIEALVFWGKPTCLNGNDAA
jgi:hypothetical protein